jgi:hypothetical protein
VHNRTVKQVAKRLNAIQPNSKARKLVPLVERQLEKGFPVRIAPHASASTKRSAGSAVNAAAMCRSRLLMSSSFRVSRKAGPRFPDRRYPEAVALDLEQPIGALEARAASSYDLKRKVVECANQHRYWPLFS